ncbi:MAG TPA: T9SS type B sorting domain-containing protein [Flavobacterium sp.]|jgi:gliding motility-associated-like protein
MANDGNALFDPSIKSEEILNGQPSQFEVKFYYSESNALLGTDEITGPISNITNNQPIFYKILYPTNDECAVIGSFALVVIPQPDAGLEEVYTICEATPIIISATSGYDSYLWSNGATTPSTIISQAGNYSLTITNQTNGFVCESITQLAVDEAGPAVILEVETVDWSDAENQIIIHVEGTGDFEYSLDGITYQMENYFSNLPPGEVIVYVRDKNGCGVTSHEVYLLMYPKYFTPNGDGFNDIWKIKLSEREPQIVIEIYDRYGKLLNSLKGDSDGWNGTYNSALLPSSDYWFVVKRNNKEFKGHFALKR